MMYRGLHFVTNNGYSFTSLKANGELQTCMFCLCVYVYDRGIFVCVFLRGFGIQRLCMAAHARVCTRAHPSEYLCRPMFALPT